MRPFVSLLFIAAFTAACAIQDHDQGGVRSVTVNGASLSYIDRGKGPPVVLVHGFLRDYRHWQAFIDEAARSHRVIAYSRRNSFPNRPSDIPLAEETDAADLTALIETLRLPPVHLVGHSFGGTVALGVAATRPELVRSLTLEEGGLVSDGPMTQETFAERGKAMAELTADIRAGQPTVAVRKFNDAVLGAGAYERASAAERQSWLENVFTLLLPRTAKALPCESIRNIKVPTLVTLGDRTVPFILSSTKEVIACLANEEVVTIHDAWHDIHISNPKEFNAAVLDFIAMH
jgi:non-heme chloroperoxidase